MDIATFGLLPICVCFPIPPLILDAKLHNFS
jgi:hypothetical protein